jgi:magnesium-transporting ATPase (P-type)
VGNKKLMEAAGVEMEGEVEAVQFMVSVQSRARTVVLVCVDKRLVGAVSVMDPIKPESGGVVACLHQMRIECHMVTGDNWGTARAIAEELGILHVRTGRNDARKGRDDVRKGRDDVRKGRDDVRKGRDDVRKGRDDVRKVMHGREGMVSKEWKQMNENS